MIELQLKNIKEVPQNLHEEFQRLCEQELKKLQKFFSRYNKNMTFEVIINHSSSTYTVSASLNLKSKKVVVAEESIDPLEALKKVLSELRNASRNQYEKEKKDYEYKRKR